jgi:PAS domain-containing protein
LVFVDVGAGAVAAASRGFEQQMLRHGESREGWELFELMAFDDPGVVRRLLAEGGVLDECRYHVGPEERRARLVASRFDYQGCAYAGLAILDHTDAAWLRSAVDVVPGATLVVGHDGRLRYASTGASALLGELYSGLDAGVALAHLGVEEEAWRRDAATTLRLSQRGLTLCSEPLRLPSGSGGEALWLVTLRPTRDGEAM